LSGFSEGSGSSFGLSGCAGLGLGGALTFCSTFFSISSLSPVLKPPVGSEVGAGSGSGVASGSGLACGSSLTSGSGFGFAFSKDSVGCGLVWRPG